MLAAITLSPVGLATAFTAGFLSFISPCVWPLVPAYLSYVSGVAYEELGANVRRVTLATAFFVAGFTIVFTALGIGAAQFGGLVIDHRRTLEVVGGVLVILMGLVLIGVGGRLFGREVRVHVRSQPASLGGALVAGHGLRDRLDALHRPDADRDPGRRRRPATRPTARRCSIAYSLGLGRAVPARGPRPVVDGVRHRRAAPPRRVGQPHRRHDPRGRRRPAR